MRRLSPGAVLRFYHVDALENPKPNRPGIVNETLAGRYSVYYGSTFKRGGAPNDAIVADPRSAFGTPERNFADRLRGAIDEHTSFHGSMLSEVEGSAEGTRVYAEASCPRDILDILEEQAEDWLLAFAESWRRTAWIQPPVRAGLMHALWWQAKLEWRDRLALTLLVYDGWQLAEIDSLRKADVRSGVWVFREGIPPRRLMPRTSRMLELWDAAPESTLGYTDIASELEPVWTHLLTFLDMKLRHRWRWQQVLPKVTSQHA